MPTERVHERSRLLHYGEQCRLCLRAYQVGERVRRLPCRHKFHIDCIGNTKHTDIDHCKLIHDDSISARWMAFTQSSNMSG